jgi:hypothetical protein
MSTTRLMLKIALIVAGFFALAIVAFIFWFARHPIVFTAPVTTKLTASASRDEGAHVIRCTLRFTGSSRPHTVTEIKMLRESAEALGATPPSGFTEQRLVAESKNEDQEFIEKFNRENIRWVGQLPVPRDQDVVISIPVQKPGAGRGAIHFQYEHRGRFGGSIQFCRATLEGQ